MHNPIRKAATLLGASVALLAGGLVSPGQALAQPASPVQVASVPCVDSLPPTGGFYRDERFYNPYACQKCQERGAYWERNNDFEAHCQKLYNQAGTITGTQLYLRCIACRNEQ